MNKNKMFTYALIIIMNSISSYSQITYRHKPIKNDPWQAESLWVGAGLVSRDSLTDIVVSYKRNAITNFVGALYFMVPGHQDSAKFLFHNFHNRFSNEITAVNLGKFHQGTELVFMYMITDTSKNAFILLGKKFYTGQNRPGIDKYVCAYQPNPRYGRRNSLAGKIDFNRVEVGFQDFTLSFDDIVFEVTGASIVR